MKFPGRELAIKHIINIVILFTAIYGRELLLRQLIQFIYTLFEIISFIKFFNHLLYS
jgi:hypothetical protein